MCEYDDLEQIAPKVPSNHSPFDALIVEEASSGVIRVDSPYLAINEIVRTYDGIYSIYIYVCLDQCDCATLGRLTTNPMSPILWRLLGVFLQTETRNADCVMDPFISFHPPSLWTLLRRLT